MFGSIVPYLLIIGMVEPILAATVAWLALDEHLSAARLGGGALILIGVALAETAPYGWTGRRTAARLTGR